MPSTVDYLVIVEDFLNNALRNPLTIDLGIPFYFFRFWSWANIIIFCCVLRNIYQHWHLNYCHHDSWLPQEDWTGIVQFLPLRAPFPYKSHHKVRGVRKQLQTLSQAQRQQSRSIGTWPGAEAEAVTFCLWTSKCGCQQQLLYFVTPFLLLSQHPGQLPLLSTPLPVTPLQQKLRKDKNTLEPWPLL